MRGMVRGGTGSGRGNVVLRGLLLLDDQHPPNEAPKGLPIGNHYRACAPIGLEKPNEPAACEERTGSRRGTLPVF